jgi:hypothetical protein
VFNNLTMRSAIGMDVLSEKVTEWATAAESPTQCGPRVENILFSNIVMEGRVLFHMHLGATTRPPAGIRNIRYANITGTAEHACYFSGSRDIPIEEIALHNVRLLVRGEVTAQFKREAPYPASVWSSATRLPYGFYFRHARGVRLHGVEVAWGDVAGAWQGALRAENVSGMDIVDLQAGPARASAAPVLHLSNVQDVSIRACRAEAGTGTFLRLDGSDCAGNTAVGNDLARARTPFDLAADLPAGAFVAGG